MGFTDPRYCGGFESVFAIDNDSAAVAVHTKNFGRHSVCDDIENWVNGYGNKQVPKAEVVIGGPPCQGFSLLNKQRRGDARRELWQPYMDIVEISEAKAFVIENVQGLLKSPEHEGIRKRAEDLGFETDSGLLNAADYGTPQIRKRAFVVGWKRGKGASITFPPPKQFAAPDENSSLPIWKTVESAISDLPEPEEYDIRDLPPPLDIHFRRRPTEVSLRRYKAVPVGGNRFDLQRRAPHITPPCWIKKKTGGTDLFGRLWWDRPSVTIRTEFFKPEKGRYLHPDQHRPITHREAARLMGFPDDFLFSGKKIEIAKQIGNAVPPDLAAALARNVAEFLSAVTKRAAA